MDSPAPTQIATPAPVETITSTSEPTIDSIATVSPSYSMVDILPTASPSYLTVDNLPTASPSYLTVESIPTASPTYLTRDTLPTASPSYLTIESDVFPTASPSYLTVNSIPTISPTYVTRGTLPTASPSYLTIESDGFPTISPTRLMEIETDTRNSRCPDVLEKKKSLLDDLILRYDIVIDNDNRQIFCSELDYDGEGWLGFGVSKNGEMIGGTAVVGLPDQDPTKPGIYSLDGKTNSLVKRSPEEDQTLLYASIAQTDDGTILRFAKYIDAVDEDFAIKVPGVTTFIYAAADSNEFGYHGMKRGSVSLVLSNAKSWKQAKRQQRDEEERIIFDSKKKKDEKKKGKQIQGRR